MNDLLEHGITPKMPGLGPRQSMVVSALDIGSFKTCCVIAKLRPRRDGAILPGRTHAIEVLGVGYSPMRGIKNGYVIDFASAESSIRSAIDQAEQESNLTVESVIINASCGRPQSKLLTASCLVESQAITNKHLSKLYFAGVSHRQNDSQAILHALPLGYQVDSQRGIHNPVGMRAQKLATDLHLVTAEKQPLQNLLTLVDRCDLDVTALVSSPYASALASLIDDEAEVGVACIDLGAGTSDIGIFLEGQMIHSDCLAMGGQNISMDIARELGVTLEVAERIKVLHGSSLTLSSDAMQMVPIPATSVGDEIVDEIPRLRLNEIIQHRVEEILTAMKGRLLSAGFAGQAARRLLITGGGAELAGLADSAQRILDRPVRIARPLGISGLPDMTRGPAFSTAAGLLTYPQITRHEYYQPLRSHKSGEASQPGYLRRVAGWLSESF